jgi:hypothetical protein
MREWLNETHGPAFELLRHFLLRFFDSDLVTTPGQSAGAIIGAVSLLLPWFPLFAGPLRFKYAHFSGLPTPGPYRLAIRGDELWLITMVMAAIGLLTAIKWQALFPGLHDYRVLGWLPLRARQIFAAKLTALLLIAGAAVVLVAAAPSLIFPALSGGRWAYQPSLGARVLAQAASFGAASGFVFFALVALEGVLLNVLSGRLFARVTAWLQGFLVAVMLIMLVLSFSIQPQTAARLLRPAPANWLPPVWFLGLEQSLSGDPYPAMQALSHRALAALAIAFGLVLATYLASYRRHRALMMEGTAASGKSRGWPGVIFDWLVPNPRQQAVISFLARTLAGSGQHRMILTAYGGFGLAILLSGMIGLEAIVGPDRLAAACFVYSHVILLVFLLIGLRHLFALPTELKANWIFRLTEGDGRRDWMLAVDRSVLFCGAAAMLAAPFPLEVRLLGWRAPAEVLLFTIAGLLCYESLFVEWEKLPFTCSYLPNKTPAWMLSLELFGLLALLPVVNWVLLSCLYRPIAYGVILTILTALWLRVHVERRENWNDLRLKYEEAPDPAVHGLNLLR